MTGREARTTMADIAREVGVSRALVSMAFHDSPGVSEQTRARILHTAKRLGYLPRAAEPSPRRTSATLGVFLLDLRQNVYADMFEGIREVADANGRHVVIAAASHDGSRDARTLEALRASRVGVVIAPGLLLPDHEVRAFNLQVPVVTVARHVEGVDGAHSDDLAGARLATRHLIELGHERIAFLANPQTDGLLNRRRGYEETMASAGLRPWVLPSHYSRTLAAADIAPVLRLPRSKRPTAVFAHNDRAALGVLDALVHAGLSAPDDVSVIGYDNIRASQAPGTSLTTVDLHGEEMGRQAATIAMLRLAQPAAPPMTRLSEPTLVVRSTTGPVP